MSLIHKNYLKACDIPSDINEHLPTLQAYSKNLSHITECGVRFVVSSFAFADALRGTPSNKLIQVDIETNENIIHFQQLCASEGVNVVFYHQSDLECPMEPTELLFIDTWHIYGQLKRELARWHSMVSKYIIMHDTTTDAHFGETLRLRGNSQAQSEATGIPVEEINKGIWPAVLEFLQSHPEWKMEACFENNNGLTVLKRV